MTREDIKNAVMEFAYKTGETDFNALSKGFFKGVQWRITSVWHEASEKPELGKDILIEIEYDNGIKDYILPLQGDHPNVITDEQGVCFFLRDAKIIRWAYIEDLIPE